MTYMKKERLDASLPTMTWQQAQSLNKQIKYIIKTPIPCIVPHGDALEPARGWHDDDCQPR